MDDRRPAIDRIRANQFLRLPSPVSRPSVWLMLLSFSIFCFVFPFGTVLLSFDWMPFGMEWMSSLLLAMLGVSCWAWLWVNFGRAGGLLGALIFALGVALEYVGVNTGVPFGEYRYTGVLVPELPGGVPLAIGFAWLLIVVGGLFSAHWLLASFGTRPTAMWATCTLGALLAVGLDLLLEPVASLIKDYWVWAPVAGGYYGVPWSNFATWLVASFLLNMLVSNMTRPNRHLAWAWLPPMLFGMNAVMFGLVNMAHGFWVAALVAVVLVGVLLAIGVMLRGPTPGGCNRRA